MPALNFQSQWADAVEFGALLACPHNVTPMRMYPPKRTTIRKPGRAKPGDTLYLYTGQRTKECRKLGEVLCLAVTPITVWKAEGTIPMVEMGGRLLMDDSDVERLARLDTAGLWGAAELVAFFEKTYGLPFEGELICW